MRGTLICLRRPEQLPVTVEVKPELELYCPSNCGSNRVLYDVRCVTRNLIGRKVHVRFDFCGREQVAVKP